MKKYVILTNLSKPNTRPVVAHYCHSFFCRLRGLMFTRRLAPDRGVLLVQRRDSRIDASIHMLFMSMDLAVVWINQNKEVVDVTFAKHWRLAYFPKRPACYVLETSPDRMPDFDTGDKVSIDEAWMD